MVSKHEFEIMYKRCVSDNTGLEPRKLFNLVQFMMYDKTNRGRVTVEDTLELLFVRYGRDHLDNEIRSLFGEDEKNSDGQEKEVSFAEYLE
jgi:Ca2+-binding EF-hand superfamily protein